MKKFFLFSVLFATTLGVSNTAMAAKIPKNLEVWCGATDLKGKAEFPYLAAIRTVKLKHHRITHLATLYKNGKAVQSQYVMLANTTHGKTYYSADDDFSLFLKDDHHVMTRGNFRSVIHDRRGSSDLVSNGTFQCVRTKS